MSFRGCDFEILYSRKHKIPAAITGISPCKYKPMTGTGADGVGPFICSGFAFKDWFHTGASA
jgi:hypothetical protein